MMTINVTKLFLSIRILVTQAHKKRNTDGQRRKHHRPHRQWLDERIPAGQEIEGRREGRSWKERERTCKGGDKLVGRTV